MKTRTIIRLKNIYNEKNTAFGYWTNAETFILFNESKPAYQIDGVDGWILNNKYYFGYKTRCPI